MEFENISNQETLKISQTINRLKQVIANWELIYKTAANPDYRYKSGDMDEQKAREFENQIAGTLAKLNFNKQSITAEELEIIKKYLECGDNRELMQAIADKIDEEYQDPALAASQVLKEINKKNS
jgi:hypothetical protein